MLKIESRDKKSQTKPYVSPQICLGNTNKKLMCYLMLLIFYHLNLKIIYLFIVNRHHIITQQKKNE